MAIYPTPQEEQAASKALWEAKTTRDEAQVGTLLGQLATAVDEVDVPNLPAEVRTEVELRFFPAEAASKLSSSEQIVEGSSIDGGTESGGGTV